MKRSNAMSAAPIATSAGKSPAICVGSIAKSAKIPIVINVWISRTVKSAWVTNAVPVTRVVSGVRLARTFSAVIAAPSTIANHVRRWLA